MGKHIATVKSSKEQDALRVDLRLKEGGTLIIRLSRPGDWGWQNMLSRRPHEVCMRWVESSGGHYFCSGGSPQDERMFAAELEGREVKGVGPRDGTLRLDLDDAVWTPSIEWITGQSALDRIPTHFQWIYEPPTGDLPEGH